MDIEIIHESLVNGQRKQMVKQIKKYGLYDFFSDYEKYLLRTFDNMESVFFYYADAVNSYFRITHR